MARSLSAPNPLYHSDALVSNASQTTVIRKSESPVPARARLGNNTSVQSASSNLDRQVKTVVGKADSTSRVQVLRASSVSEKPAGRIVETVNVGRSSSASAAPTLPAKQSVSLRFPLSANTTTTASAVHPVSIISHRDVISDDDDGSALRQIVHSISNNARHTLSSSSAPVVESQGAERHIAALPISHARASAKISLGSISEPTFTRVVPSDLSVSSARGALVTSKVVSSSSESPMSDEVGGRQVAYSYNRRAPSSPPAAKRRSPVTASQRPSKPSKSSVKARLGPINVSSDPPSSRASEKVKVGNGRSKAKGSVFQRLGEKA